MVYFRIQHAHVVLCISWTTVTRCWFQILLFAGPFLRWFPTISPNAPAQRCMRLVLWLCCWVTTGAGPQPRVWVQNLGMNTRPQCQGLFKFRSSATQRYFYIFVALSWGAMYLAGHSCQPRPRQPVTHSSCTGHQTLPWYLPFSAALPGAVENANL